MDTDGFPEEFNEEDGLPDSDDAPPPPERDTREPRTDELLEHYGAEYGVDETLGSPRTPNSRTPNLWPKAETFDDALFTSQRKPRAPANSRGNTTRIIGGVLVLIVMVAVVYFIGLPMLAGNGGAATITPRRNPPLPGHPRQPRPQHPFPFQGHSFPKSPKPYSPSNRTITYCEKSGSHPHDYRVYPHGRMHECRSGRHELNGRRHKNHAGSCRERVHPGDDFYTHVNDAWLRSHPGGQERLRIL